MPDNPRWKRRPPGSNWGDWGADDQLGRLNLLTPEKVLKGIAEVRERQDLLPVACRSTIPGGTVVNPRRHPPRLIRQPAQRHAQYDLSAQLRGPAATSTSICDDMVEMTLQYSTQWDSLAHVGQMFDADGDGEPEDVFYNGYRAGETS